MNLPRHATLVALGILAAAQLLLVIDFYAGLRADGIGGFLLLMIGIGLCLLEIFMIALADRTKHEDRPRAAAWWLVLFFVVLTLNSAADFGAITTVTATDQAERARQRVLYEQNERALARANAEIGSLERNLPGREYNQPSRALRSLLAEREARRAQFERRNWAVPLDLSRRIVRLESAIATMEEIERQKAERDRAEAFLAEHRRPNRAHPQFEALAALLAGVGIHTTPEAVRIGVAFALVIVLKLVLTTGFFVTSGGKRAADDNLDSPANWRRWRNWPFTRPKAMIPETPHRYGPAPMRPLPTVRPPKRSPWQNPGPKPRRFGPDTEKDFDDYS